MIRTRFEKRAKSLGYNLSRNPANEYSSVVTQNAWNEWQIAWRASREPFSIADTDFPNPQPAPPLDINVVETKPSSWAALMENSKPITKLVQDYGLPPGFLK